MDAPSKLADPILDGEPVPRILGEIDSGRPGPTVVVFGAVHGNEPSGVRAARVVLQELEATPTLLRGRLVALSGNRRALGQQVRFVDRDLNRRWTDEGVRELLAADPSEDRSEDGEQREILGVLQPLLAESAEPVVILDLHTMSGEGAPFCCMSDTLRNRPIAEALPIPVILGLEEVINGSMLGYLSDLGHRGIAVEGGRHDAADTVQNHVAATYLALVAAGALREEDVPEVSAHRARLATAAAGLPRVVEVRYRHVLRDDEPFEMQPGFVNFDPIQKGQVLAHGELGPIASPEDGLMLLPRYQGQGEDGFFVARRVPASWLAASALARTSGLDRYLHLLPDVVRDPENPDVLRLKAPVSGRVRDLLHLWGYRRRQMGEDVVIFSRRRPDNFRPTP